MEKTNSQTINSCLIVAASILGPACRLAAQPASGISDKRMNVIFILADDLGYGDLGCTGQQKIKTPNIDRLAGEGMLFTGHYSGSTVSAPSRSALLTGLHTGHTPIRGNKAMTVDGERGQAPIPAGTYNMAAMFRSAGYKTGAFGKWGLGYPGSEGDPVNQGFDEFFGYNCQGLAHRYYPEYLWHNDKKVILEGNADHGTGDYTGDIIHTEALRFIEENSGGPFFAFLPYTLPHAELIVPEDDIIEYYRGLFPEKPFRAGGKNDYGPEMSATGYCSQPMPNATYAAMVTRLDRYVGQVMELLHRLGIADDTIVMFTSDNGPHREGGCDPDFFQSYGPFRGTKRSLYEGGIRLPLIAWAPGTIKAGIVNEHLCASWDMLPTLAEAVGAKIPASARLDGISILPSLTGNGQQARHDHLYWEFHEQNGTVAVRMGKWKAVRRNAWKDGAHTELYDLSTDIHEDNDLAGSHPGMVARMENIMRRASDPSDDFPFPSKW